MDTVTILATAFCSILGALAGSGVIYYRQNRRLKEIEVESRQSEEWRRLYEKSDGDNREKDRKIHELYAERQQIYNLLIKRDSAIARKDIQIEQLKFSRCDVNGCIGRRPPRKYEFYEHPEKTDSP